MGSRVEGDVVGCTTRGSVGRPRVHGRRLRRRRGGGEEGGEESSEGEAPTYPYPQPRAWLKPRPLAWSVEQRQSHYSTVAQCIASCRTGAPLRIELQLLQFRNRRGEPRVFCTFCSHLQPFSARLPPKKDVVRRKALQSCPAQRKNFLQRGRVE